MQFPKIYNKGQAKLFNNRYLEILTKTHPLVIWALYLPLVVFFLYFSGTALRQGPGRIALLFLSGLIFWSLFEYMIHRFAFHFMAESKRMSRIVYLIHGNHHEYPRDKQRLFMPPVPSILIAALVFSLMYLPAAIAGRTEWVFAFFPGFVLGYLLYGSMHYAIHAWHPPFKWMKPLWRNHHLHHYKEQEKGFGVSSTLWDHVFGTMFDLKNEQEDKEKVRELTFVSKPKGEQVN